MHFYPERDLSYAYKVEREAQIARNAEFARLAGAAFRAIGRGLKKLDLWFEAARQVNALPPETFTGVVAGRYHLPAIFTDAEKVVVEPANDDRTKWAA